MSEITLPMEVKCGDTFTIKNESDKKIILKISGEFVKEYEELEWIKITEKLPDEGVKVILYENNIKYNCKTFIMGKLVILKNGKKYWRTDRYKSDLNGFDYWMPVPKPPGE